MRFQLIVLFFSIYFIYDVNCYRSLDANIWVPSFERFSDDRNYINDFGFNKLKQEENKQNFIDYNNYDEDDVNEANNDEDDDYEGNDFENDLIKYKKFFSKSLKNRDSLNDLFNPYGSSEETFNNARDHESEIHSSLVGGYQFVSGGAGEGKQHLNPQGEIPNKEEVKSDIDLPAYCDPPNPCPIGYKGDDCDRRPYEEFTAEYSKMYQSKQNCICDNDHNECKKHSLNGPINEQKIQDLLKNMKLKDKSNSVVAKKSPRAKRDLSSQTDNNIKEKKDKNSEQPLYFHVAKKSPHV